MFESNGLDPAPKKGVALFQAIERGIQLRDNVSRLIGDDDQFDLDLFVEYLNASSLQVYACYRAVLNLPENVLWIQMLYLTRAFEICLYSKSGRMDWQVSDGPEFSHRVGENGV